MKKTTVKSLVGGRRDKAVIVSESGMAVSYTGNGDDDSGFVRMELNTEYKGEPRIVYPTGWSHVKASLELEEVSEIRADGKRLLFGSVAVECADGIGLLPEEIAGRKAETVAEYDLDAETTETLLRFSEYASKDELRYFMNGVFLAENGDIAATDGRRLGVLKTDFKFGNWIVKRDIFQKLRKAKQIRIELLEVPGLQFLRLSGGGVSVICKPINGTFPPYEKVIPSTFSSTEKNRIEFDYAKFKACIKEATGGKDDPGTVVLYKGSVWCGNTEVGRLNFQADKPMFMNPVYLADALKDGGNISWSEDEKSGEVMKAVLFGTKRQMSVVMPKFRNDNAMPSKIND